MSTSIIDVMSCSLVKKNVAKQWEPLSFDENLSAFPKVQGFKFPTSVGCFYEIATNCLSIHFWQNFKLILHENVLKLICHTE